MDGDKETGCADDRTFSNIPSAELKAALVKFDADAVAELSEVLAEASAIADQARADRDEAIAKCDEWSGLVRRAEDNEAVARSSLIAAITGKISRFP